MLEPFSLLPPGDAQEIPRASINVLEGDATYAQVSLGPLPKGYADTIGNSLRRVLLSSIKGSAVTEVKILDVMHEYSAIPGVKEEVMDLLLNIKRIRIRSPLARSGNGRVGKMRLETQGPGPVCAGDIATSADFEIVNPELHLATLDDASIELSIEFTVEAGKKGYQRAEENQGLSVGVLPVDAIFNPVQKVTHHRNSTRVGDQHDLDNLVLELWTAPFLRWTPWPKQRIFWWTSFSSSRTCPRPGAASAIGSRWLCRRSCTRRPLNGWICRRGH